MTIRAELYDTLRYDDKNDDDEDDPQGGGTVEKTVSTTVATASATENVHFALSSLTFFSLLKIFFLYHLASGFMRYASTQPSTIVEK